MTAMAVSWPLTERGADLFTLIAHWFRLLIHCSVAAVFMQLHIQPATMEQAANLEHLFLPYYAYEITAQAWDKQK